MAFNTLIYEEEGGIITITFTRPKQMNALNTEFIDELGKAIDQAEQDEKARAIVLTGGSSVFCAGADLKEVNTWINPAVAARFLNNIRQVFNKIDMEVGKPVIAAVGGYALGGGLELCLACDLRVAADNAVFGAPEIKLGIIPGAGGTQRLPRTIGITRASHMVFTGQSIKADEALRIGLVNMVVPADKLAVEAKNLAKVFLQRAPLSVKAAKRALKKGRDMELNSALAFEIELCSELFATQDQKEGVRAFLEKRPAVFEGK